MKNESELDYDGILKMGSNLVTSYVSQNTDFLDELTLKQWIQENQINEPVFKAMLTKMGVGAKEFQKKMKNMSEGQKKKVLLAKSISENANIYLWDEPFNFVDIPSREQIEKAILQYQPTMIFVEHDETFVNRIATKILKI